VGKYSKSTVLPSKCAGTWLWLFLWAVFCVFIQFDQYIVGRQGDDTVEEKEALVRTGVQCSHIRVGSYPHEMSSGALVPPTDALSLEGFPEAVDGVLVERTPNLAIRADHGWLVVYSRQCLWGFVREYEEINQASHSQCRQVASQPTGGNGN